MALNPREEQLIGTLIERRWVAVGTPASDTAPRFFRRPGPVSAPILLVIRGADGEPRVFREVPQHKIDRAMNGLG